MKRFFLTAGLALAALFQQQSTQACTNILISRAASADGSNMITYSADSHALYGEMYFRPAATYPAGTMLDVYEWDTGKYLGKIPQVESTYSVMGNINEHQLIIAESTFGGRSELRDKEAVMDYGSLIYITLQRTKTAREAIEMIAQLANEYGYYSSGESFSIADKDELWYMELIGKGTKMVDGKNVNKGIVWVAQRIPNGAISAHANQARITTFDMNDPENVLYSPDVVSFAREAGYFKGKDKDFSFADAYAPLDFGAMRFCDARVWSAFNILGKEDMSQYLDYAMGDETAKRLPLYVMPKEKVTVKAVADAMRDHYEGTPMDMTKDIGAGPSALPYRWRPLTFKIDGESYFNERAIATQQTGFWFVAQSRPQLPDEVGALVWFGVDDAATSPLTPIYVSSSAVAEPLQEGNGSLLEFSPTSAFWMVSRVANLSYLRYDLISKDIRHEIDKHEEACFAEVAQVDKVACELLKQSPELAKDFLTTYSVTTAEQLYDVWDGLDEFILMKYLDGNVKQQNEDGSFKNNGNNNRIPASPKTYAPREEFLRVLKSSTGDHLKVK